MLVVLLPLMALIALAIKIDNPGPVLYCQQRAGLLDRPFTLFKFRSMVPDAEANGSPIGRSSRTHVSPGSAVSSARPGSTNCRN